MACLITPECIIPSLRSCDPTQAIAQMVDITAEKASFAPCAVLQTVVARGEHSTFGFGRGIAVPHAPLSGLERPLGIFARLWPAQNFGAADGLPSDLAFLLLSPDGDDSMHLRALACVVRRLRDLEVAECLRSANDADALYVMLTSDAWREHDGKPESGPFATPQASNLRYGGAGDRFRGDEYGAQVDADYRIAPTF